MKEFTDSEKTAALGSIPIPTRDFLKSQDLTRIYLGLKKKHALDLRQLMVLSEITYNTLLGLEKETNLETNMHQWLHELSNEKTRELVLDINDRIFKEANRRLRENIVTPEKPWDEKTFGPKDEYLKMLDARSHRDDRDIARQIEDEAKNPPSPAEKDDYVEPASIVENKSANLIANKLALPTTTVSADSAAASQPVVGIQQIQKTSTSSEIKPIAAPPPPRLKGDSDPYRELAD